jgi:hypothetical protein
MYTRAYEPNEMDCGMDLTVGFEALPLIGFRPALRTVKYRLVGMILLRSSMRSRSQNVHPFSSGVVSPSPGPDEPWARTESQKEVYGGSNRHSTFQTNKRENSGCDIFISKESYKFWSTWRSSPNQKFFNILSSHLSKIKNHEVLSCLNRCPRRSLLSGVGC